MVLSEKLGRIKSQNWNFLKINSIFFKTALFFARSTNTTGGSALYNPQNHCQWPAALKESRQIQGTKEIIWKIAVTADLTIKISYHINSALVSVNHPLPTN